MLLGANLEIHLVNDRRHQKESLTHEVLTYAVNFDP